MGIKAKTQITQHQVHYQKTQPHIQQNQEMLIKEANYNAHQNLNKKHANGIINEHKNLGKF
jgi:hypothetical protein